MVVSVTLSRGALRMAAKKVIVKRLASIQNLGSMDVFCTDKTGTLTEARIHLERSMDALGRDSERVLKLAYFNSFFETGLKSPLDDAILEHKEIDVTGWHKIDEVPFDFERRRVSVLLDKRQDQAARCQRSSRRYSASVGHAMRRMEKRTCVPLMKRRLVGINAQFEGLSKEGFRVLGIASRRWGWTMRMP